MISKLLKTLLIYLLKRYGVELIVDLSIQAAEKSAALTATNLDDNAVAKFKADKPALMKLIQSFL